MGQILSGVCLQHGNDRRPVQHRAGGRALAAAFSLGLAASAHGQVLEIGPGGVVTHAGPAVYVREAGALVSHPIAVAQAASSRTGPVAIVEALATAAARQSMPASLVRAVAWQESRNQPQAVSSKDARGVMQLSAAAALDVGVDRNDITQNIEGGAAYLRRMIDAFGGDVVLGLAAYNAGPGAVRRYGGVPPFPETQAYVTGVLRRVALTKPAEAWGD